MTVLDGAPTAKYGLLPAWARCCGWIFLLGQALFISRIVYESTVLTCANGPQMVGFAMAHGAHKFFLLGLPFVPLGAVFFMVALIFGAAKRLRFNVTEWALLLAVLGTLSLLILPYEAWERFDMTVCASGPLGDAMLLDAARIGDLTVVQKLVAQGHDVNRESGSGETPLSSAVKGENQEVVAFLLSKGAKPDLHGRLSDQSLIMITAHSGNTELLKLLLARGADPCVIRNNQNAQTIAEESHHDEFAAYLAARYHCVMPTKLPTACVDESTANCVEVH